MRLKQLSDVIFCCVVRKIAVCIEAIRGIADHHLRLVDRKHVQENHHLAEMVQGTRRANSANGRSHRPG